MYRTPAPAHDRACDCGCPIHRGQLRSTYDDPRCRCVTICASQPMTLLAPQINGVLFLGPDHLLWFVPGLEPGHWDWRNATPVHPGHPLDEIGDLISDLLSRTQEGLHALTHRL
jgi:hypothetical protein